MKLFYITRVNIPSGAAQSVQIASMCEAFSNENIEFKLISTLNKENKHLNKSFVWKKVKLNSKFIYFEFVYKALNIVKHDKPSHIYTRDIVVAYLFSFFNIKIIYEAHKEPRTKVAHFMLNNLKKKKNFLLITISDALKQYYKNEYKFKDSKVFDYHDAVFIEKYDSMRDISKKCLREELKLPINRLIIMHTGSLYPGRGAEHFETIMKNFTDILFVQVGGTKNDIEKYQELYKDYKNILFVGHQSQDILIKYQMSADLLFYPMTEKTLTYWCCSPMKIFEFMATGIPILSSNVGSVSEVLNSDNSIPFDPKSEQSIIDGVEIFLNKREIVVKRAKKALEDVREKYTWKKRVNEILKFIGDKI